MERPPPSARQIQDALERVLRGSAFKGAKRAADLLRYVVNAALTDPARIIKEHELGAQALGRGDRFDPRFDPIARVEASRLRGRLGQYYAVEGAADPIRIELPKGGYTPVFDHQKERAALPAPGGDGQRRRAAAWFAAGVTATVVFAAALLVPALRRSDAEPPPPAPATFDVALGAPGVLTDTVGSSLALSADGKVLVTHVLLADGSTQLFARRLDSPDAKALPGTVGAAMAAVSKDGRWVAFWTAGKILKTQVDGGGSPLVLADATDIQGLSWSEDGFILASVNRDNTLQRIPQDGGPSTLLTVGAAEDGAISWPHVLPRGRGVLFTVIDREAGKYRIEVARRDGSQRKFLVPSGTYARYAASGPKSGHVLYVDRGTLFALPFDIDTFEVLGEPRPVIRDVAYRDGMGHAYYDVANDGTLVYLRAPGGGLSTIRWLDGGDKSRPILSEPGRYLYPRLSPDGRRLAYAVADGPTSSLWVLDLASGGRLHLGGDAINEGNPVWTPDSRRLILSSGGATALGWREADGSSETHMLTPAPGVNIPWSLGPDGGRIAYYSMDRKTHFDLWTVPLRSGPQGLSVGTPEPFLQTPAVETYPAFSPDGQWMAYNSNESRDFDVYVRAFPDSGRRVKVSAAGGLMALWSRTRPELFYKTNDHRLMVAPFRIVNGAFVPGEARLWSTWQLTDTGVFPNYDLAPDGRSVVALVPNVDGSEKARDHFSVVINFFDELRSDR
jgi:serine/threonine-protein kinase